MLALRRSITSTALRTSRTLGNTRAVHLEANKASVQALIKNSPVLVFSKTHCPHSSRVKELLKDLDAKFELVELDEREDGPEIQALLLELTKQRTVPNVFIKGKHIGGADDTISLHASKQLVPLLQ